MNSRYVEDTELLIKTADGFNAVYGADCFLDNWPEIETSGIWVRLKWDGYYYVLGEDSNPVDSTAFFSEEELEFIEVLAVKQPR